jgi:hypothetical protein
MAGRAVLPSDEADLKITKLIGRAENAVRTQMAVALIAFLLVRVPREITKDACRFLELFDSCANLMPRKDAA